MFDRDQEEMWDLDPTDSLPFGVMQICKSGRSKTRKKVIISAVAFSVCAGVAHGDSFDISSSTILTAPLVLYDGDLGVVRAGVEVGVGETNNIQLLGGAILDVYGTVNGENIPIRVYRDLDRTENPDIGGRTQVIFRSGATLSTNDYAGIHDGSSLGFSQVDLARDIGTDILIEAGAIIENSIGNAIRVETGLTLSTRATIINYGTVRSTGANRRGIEVAQWGLVKNFGLIEGIERGLHSGAYGVEVRNYPGGIIRGGTGLHLDRGDAGNVFIINEGIIEGTGGNAFTVNNNNVRDVSLTNRGRMVGNVSLSLGNDIFTLLPGSEITGTVNAGNGTDTLRADVSFDTYDCGAGYHARSNCNPDPAKYLNFEVFEFIQFRREISADTAEELSVEADREIRFTGAASINALAVANGGNVVISAPVVSAGDVVNSGAVSVTADARLTAPRFSGTGTLSIATGSTLTLEQSGDSSFAGRLSGSGNFVKEGTGRITLTGNHDLSGQFEVRAGALVVTGNIATASLNVGSSARLEGSGTVGSLSVAGALAPGNSPGTLVSTGDVTLNANGTLEWEVDGLTYSAAGGAGSYDRIVLTGVTSTFTAGGTLEPILRGITGAANNDFTPVYGDAFTLVTTANPNGVSGTFATVAQPADGLPANARFDVLYFANRVDAVVTPGSYATFASSFVGTANTRSFGQALDVVRPAAGANPDTAIQTLFTNLYPLNGTQLASAFGALSGEIHAFAVNDARDSVETLSSNSYVGGLTPQARGRNAWADFSFDQMSYSTDRVASSYESTSRTLWAGLDLEQSSDLRYGFAFGRTWSDVGATSSGSVSGETTMLMGYYAAEYSHLSFGATVGVGRSSFDTQRSVGFGSGTETALASGDAEFASVSFETAYQRELAANMNGNLWADVSMIFMAVDGYAETGSALISSAVAEDSYRSGVLEVGYEITVTPTFLGDDTSGLTTFGFGLRHEFGSDRQYARRVSMHGAEWDVTSHDLSPTSAFAAVGFNYDIGDGQTISGHLSGEGNRNYSSYGAALSFVRRF